MKSIVYQAREFLTHPIFLFLVFCMGFVGLYYSRALVSLFDVGLFGLGLIHLTQRGDWIKAIWNRHTIPFLLIYLLYLASAYLSENSQMALMRLKTNNYFVLIPLGISFLQPFTKRFISQLLLAFIGISFLSTLLVSFEYLLHYDAYSESYKTGKTIPTPILHIRYSFFITIATLLGIVMYIKKEKMPDFARKALPFIAGFLFLFLHVLAVRTGLLGLYLGLLLFLVISGRKYVRLSHLLGSAVVLILVLIFSFQFIPSLKYKLQYSKHDITMFLEGKGHYLYSDNLRLISIQNGLELLNTHPMVGVDIGDMEDEMQKLYAINHQEIPHELRALPINQFVFSLVAFGLVGGILYIIFIFYPLTYSGQWNDPKLIVIYGATIASFLGDASIELQLGKVAFVTFISLSLWDITTSNKKRIQPDIK